MDSEEYRIRCKNFRDKTRSSFKYLVEEFNYELKYDSNRSQSGSIIVDTLIYTNKKRNRIIKISNSFHPKDRGFQLTILDSSNFHKNIISEKLLYSTPLISQDINQDYLEKTAEKLKEFHSKVIQGKTFFDDAFEFSTVIKKNKKSITVKHILIWVTIYLIFLLLQFLFNKQHGS